MNGLSKTEVTEPELFMGQTVDNLTVSAWNCQGAMRSSVCICEILNSLRPDIMVLCEHWLFPDSVNYLDSISPEHTSYAVSDKALDVLCPYRRGKGGVAIMWKKTN